MKWRNHQVVGFALAYAITGHVFISLAGLLMSIIPDAMEGGHQLKMVKHRGLSHNILLWAAVLLPAYFFFPSQRLLATAAIAGVASHFLCDSLTLAGVPVWKNKILAFKFFHTGSVTEYVVAYAALAAAFCYRPLQMPSLEHTMENAKDILYALTQPHFASWLISVLPYNFLALSFLIVAVWMIVFRELFSFGIGLIILAITLFFVGQSMT